jgi:hypothetical protein
MRSLRRTPTTLERLERAAAILELLDRRRASAGDPHIGSNIERLIVSRELAELEEEILREPGPLAAWVARPAPRRRAAFNS